MQGYTLRLETVLQTLRDTELASLSCQVSFPNGRFGTGFVVAKQGKAVACTIYDANGEVTYAEESAYQVLDSSERRWRVDIQVGVYSSFDYISSSDVVTSNVLSPIELSHRLSILLTSSQEKPPDVITKEVIAVVKALAQADFCSLEFSSEMVREERTPFSMTIPLKLEDGIEKKYFGKLVCSWRLAPPVEAELILPMAANWISLYASTHVNAPNTLPFFQALLAKRASRDNLVAQANLHHVDLLQQAYVIVLAQQQTGTLDIVQQALSSLSMRHLLFLSDPYMCALVQVTEARTDLLLQTKLAEVARTLNPSRSQVLIAMGLPTAYSSLPFPENFRESALHAAAALLELSFQRGHVFFSYREDYQYSYRLQTPPIATTQFLYHLEHLERSERSSSRLIDVLEVYLFSQSNSQKEMADQLTLPTSTYLRRFERIQEECKKYFQMADPKIVPTMQAAMAIYRQRTKKQKTPEELLHGLLHL